MKIRKLISSFILVVTLSLSFSSTVFASDVPQIVLDSSSSVVYIEVDTATETLSGSGFVINNDINGTYIATNNHVIAGNINGVSVWTGESEKRSASVVVSNDEYDLAIIKLTEPIEKKELVLSTVAAQGEEVFAVGYPIAANALSQNEAHISNEATITNGIISSVKSMKNVDYGPNVKLLQINAEINPGNSGGPLLNSKGQVVGINTYGVIDSQGIFGAISVAELITLINDNQLFQISTEVNSSNLILVILFVLLVAVIIGGILVAVKFYRKKSNTIATTDILLNEYLSNLGSDIDDCLAVSLMMPIILYIRNKHNEGSVFLKLSPSRIYVTKNGCKIGEIGDLPTDEFLSPEQRKGTFAGIKADVYGICSIIYHMLSFHRNKISCEENNNVVLNSDLINILKKGLSENPDERYSNVQELIYALSPFNIGIDEVTFTPISNESLNKDTANNKKKPRIFHDITKKKVLIFSSLCLGLILLIFVGYSVVRYSSAMNYATQGEFRQASTEISNTPFAQVLFSNDFNYIGAGIEMLNRNYDSAIAKLEALAEYNGANELLSEAKYRKAGMFTDQKRYEEARKIYEELGTYKDASSLINDTTFREASYYLSIGRYQSAEEILIKLSNSGYTTADSKLKELYYTWGLNLSSSDQTLLQGYDKLKLAEDYADAEQIRLDLIDIIYYKAIDDYRSGLYDIAELGFKKIGSYLDSDSFLVLIQAHQEYAFSFDSSLLWPLIGFEDAAQLILANDFYAQYFLLGNWKGDSKYFKMDDDGYISYNVPWFNYGDYYRIENGKILFFKKDSPEITKTLFEITIINQNCIQILSHKNYRTYTLFRQ